MPSITDAAARRLERTAREAADHRHAGERGHALRDRRGHVTPQRVAARGADRVVRRRCGDDLHVQRALGVFQMDDVREGVVVRVVHASSRHALVVVAAAQQRGLDHRGGFRYFSGSWSNFCLQTTAQK